MSLGMYIKDPSTGLLAQVVDEDYKYNALVVATRPLKEFKNTIKPFINADYGISLNQNALSTGVPIRVHDGIDSTLWTGTNVVGDTEFQKTDRSYAGTYSIKVEQDQGSIFQLSKGSYQDLTDYISLTLWINADKNWFEDDSVELYGWDSNTGLIVGNKIQLENYFSYLDYDVWHKISIPLYDLGLTNLSIDSFRFEITNQDGKKAKFYIDEFQIEESGTPIEFTVKPDKQKWCHIYNMTFMFVDEYNSTLTDSTMPNLSYDKILNMDSLSSGLIWRLMLNNEVSSSFNLKNLGEALELPSANIKNFGCDGTNTFLTLEYIFTEPIILKPEENDYLSITISDDLTGFLKFRSYVGCKEELRDI